jgi:hypothetical protein
LYRNPGRNKLLYRKGKILTCVVKGSRVMRHHRFCVGLLALFGILLPAFAADDNTDPATKLDGIQKKVYDQIIKSGIIRSSKLAKVDSDKHVLTVEVTYKAAKQDAQAVQHLYNLQRQLVQAQLQRNPAERLKQVSRIQQDIDKATANLYKDHLLKIELDAPDDMKVRTRILPVEFDDKGKPRRLTEKEKKELKGPDPTLPGYTADWDSLKADQTVEVRLAKKPSKPKDKDQDKDKKKDEDKTEVTRPEAAMLVILAEAKK